MTERATEQGAVPEHPDASAALAAALLGEAMTKSGLLWIEVDGDRTWPAWHVWDDGAALVVSGPGEQPLPWLPPEVRVILRSKDTGGRLLTVRAHVHVLEPGTPSGSAPPRLLRASRLNAVDDSLTRWAAECTVARAGALRRPRSSRRGRIPPTTIGPPRRAPPRRRPRGARGTGVVAARRRPSASAPATRRRPPRAAKERAKLRKKRQRRGTRRRGR